MKPRILYFLLFLLVALALLAIPGVRQRIMLSTSKVLITPVPGDPRPMGAFPVNIALSPDQKYAAILEAGFGTPETDMHQSIAVLDFDTNQITRFADPRLPLNARQSFFLGIAWSSDGRYIYAPICSITDPDGSKAPDPKKDKDDKYEHTGNGIAVYAFNDGKITPERFLKIPPQPLAAGKKRGSIHQAAPEGTLAPYPAGIAVLENREAAPNISDEGKDLPRGDQLLVADNLSDDVLLMDTLSGTIIRRFDFSAGSYVPSAYPHSVIVGKDHQTAWASLWNSSEVVHFALSDGHVFERLKLHPPTTSDRSGSHPSSMVLSGSALFVALSNSDKVAVIADGKITYLSTRLPGQQLGGSYPIALAANLNGTRLYVADASNDAVAVFQMKTRGNEGCIDNCGTAFHGSTTPSAFLPTEWYPTALAVRGDDLLIATGKGVGPGPDNIPRKVGEPGYHKGYTYIAALLKGSLARVHLKEIEPHLKQLTDEVLESNLMNGRTGTLPFKAGKNPIKHVIYVIKENRSYDQVFGDLGVGNGDSSLTLYGNDITPNQHALALQFGVLDNFYDSGEVSGNGHVWSNAAITSDYTEKTWQITYRGNERTYDYEGFVADDSPLELGIPDINEPGTGYLWTNLARHKKTYRQYSEYIATRWCDNNDDWQSPLQGTPLPKPAHCQKEAIKSGEPLPANLGDPKGGPNPFPWEIPNVGESFATKPELVGHFDPHYAGFRLDYPDQLRVDEFLNEFNQWVAARPKSKADPMPQFITMRLGNDHTAGTTPGKPTPEASVADNDLAVGRLVDAVSHSPYWDDTAIFVLEDDAQDGADHVDAHRSIALVISKYAPREFTMNAYVKDAPKFTPENLIHFVDSHFYTTVNVIHTMETLIGLPPMNNNDAQAAILAPLFAGPGTQPPYIANYRNRDNRMIFTANKKKAVGAAASSQMNFRHADQVDTALLNSILWQERKGSQPMPPPKHTVFSDKPRQVKDDDD